MPARPPARSRMGGSTAVAGLTSGPLAIVLTSWVQRLVDDRFRGRVASVNTLANLGITPLAMAAMGAGPPGVPWTGQVVSACRWVAASRSSNPTLRSAASDFRYAVRSRSALRR
jgi:hypothetical protein